MLQMNPQHNVPTIRDGDFCMNESRAIAAYIANAYGKGSNLYPEEPKVRARVDQRLYFDMGVFYKSFGETVVSVSRRGSKNLHIWTFLHSQYPKKMRGEAIPDSAYDKLHEVLQWVSDFIKPTGYAAGTDHMTIADLVRMSRFLHFKKFNGTTPYFDVLGLFGYLHYHHGHRQRRPLQVQGDQRLGGEMQGTGPQLRKV